MTLYTHQWDGGRFRGFAGREDLAPPSEEHGDDRWYGSDGREVVVRVIATGPRGAVALEVGDTVSQAEVEVSS
jgi:hypothetical protein